MIFHIKRKNMFRFECSCQVGDDIVASCEFVYYNDEILIPDIEVKQEFRYKGYGTTLVRHLQETHTVKPVGVLETAKSWWAKIGLEDCIGREMPLSKFEEISGIEYSEYWHSKYK
jgi:N-acetylglutamate synthase-like GNAT family acetyltransferase